MALICYPAQLCSQQFTDCEVFDMQPFALDDARTKELITEVLVEMLQQKREIFYELILAALEEVGLANAICEGRQDDFVSEEVIFKILEGES